MGFLICCDNKGCGQSTEALLNTKTNMAHCTECGKEIQSVTHFAKVTLKSMGQTMKSVKTNKSFSINCPECGVQDQPTVNRNGAIICNHCNNDVSSKLSPPMAHAIRQALTGK